MSKLEIHPMPVLEDNHVDLALDDTRRLKHGFRG